MSPILPDFEKLNKNTEKMISATEKMVEFSKILTVAMKESNKLITQLDSSVKALTKEIKGDK